jgi:hypothetical protein
MFGGTRDQDYQDVSPYMKNVIKGDLLPANTAQGRLQARRVPDNLMRKIEAFRTMLRDTGEEIRVDDYNNAIVSYIVSNHHLVPLVHHMRARIYQRHLGRPREEFPQRDSFNRMVALGKRVGDDKGHILAFSLGMN